MNIVRHGPSSYQQPEWTDSTTADDLNVRGRYAEGSLSDEEVAEGKRKAEALVRATAEKIAADIDPDEVVAIWSSPTGRTLQTARIMSQVLEEKGMTLRKKGTDVHGIKVFESLGEVRNFSWELFQPLMEGGEVRFQGKTFQIEKRLSNPKNIGYPDYFTQDAIKDISAEAKAHWPSEYVAEISRFESFADVSARMARVLHKLKKMGDASYRIVLVTHDAMTGALVKTFTSNALSGVNPAQCVSVERRGDALVVTAVGDVTEGDNRTDVTARSDTKSL